MLGSPSGQWYDLPKIALTNNNLVVTASIYAGYPTSTWQRSAVLRLSLDDLAAGGSLPYSYYIPAEFGLNFFLRDDMLDITEAELLRGNLACVRKVLGNLVGQYRNLEGRRGAGQRHGTEHRGCSRGGT